jgi:adenosylcobyric acid synthase
MGGARSIFVGGTASHAGKSWMATAICRYLKRRGLRVAPFKAQNMSNNSFPCASGGEIGRAQAVQAEACGLEPEPDMNPVLLKPTSNMGAQIVVDGKVWRNLSARDYYEHTPFLRERSLAAYQRLASRFDYVVIEGAGSVTEMNLRKRDIVNLSLAREVNARAILVADIDRGGVFASITGTMCLLPDDERSLIRSFAINRFRGDISLFSDGVSFIEQRTGTPCLGVFPMLDGVRIQEEDSVSLDEAAADDGARIAILRFPHVSNFTDFRLLRAAWIHAPVARDFDWIILPGTKNTLADLAWLRARGFEPWIHDQLARGARVLGVCGGYQMLGRLIEDPHAVESETPASSPGLGLLPVSTRLEQEKVTLLARGRTPGGVEFAAYEIHRGRTIIHDGAARAFARMEGGSSDGIIAGNVYGTYLHGACENAGVAGELFGPHAVTAADAGPYDALADWFAAHANRKLFEEAYL